MTAHFHWLYLCEVPDWVPCGYNDLAIKYRIGQTFHWLFTVSEGPSIPPMSVVSYLSECPSLHDYMEPLSHSSDEFPYCQHDSMHDLADEYLKFWRSRYVQTFRRAVDQYELILHLLDRTTQDRAIFEPRIQDPKAMLGLKVIHAASWHLAIDVLPSVAVKELETCDT